MDFETLQTFASRCLGEGRYATALAVYLRMAEDDPSLDGGSLGHAIAECYERLGDLHAARYWYRRAYEENPAVDLYRASFDRMRTVLVEDLIS